MDLTVGNMDSILTVYEEFTVSDGVGGKTSMSEAYTYRVVEDGGVVEGTNCIPSSKVPVASTWCNLSYNTGNRYSANGAVEINTNSVVITIRKNSYKLNANNLLVVNTRNDGELNCMITSMTPNRNGRYLIIKADIIL